MVKHVNLEKLPGANQVARHPYIRLAGCRIPARMVVNQNDGSGMFGNRRGEHFPRMHEEGIKRALGDVLDAD